MAREMRSLSSGAFRHVPRSTAEGGSTTASAERARGGGPGGSRHTDGEGGGLLKLFTPKWSAEEARGQARGGGSKSNSSGEAGSSHVGLAAGAGGSEEAPPAEAKASRRSGTRSRPPLALSEGSCAEGLLIGGGWKGADAAAPAAGGFNGERGERGGESKRQASARSSASLSRGAVARCRRIVGIRSWWTRPVGSTSSVGSGPTASRSWTAYWPGRMGGSVAAGIRSCTMGFFGATQIGLRLRLPVNVGASKLARRV